MADSRALFLAHRIPWPPDKGDKIRSHRELLALLEEHDVTAAFFLDDPSDAVHVAAVERLCRAVIAIPLRRLPARARAVAALLFPRPLSLAYYGSGALRARLAAAGPFDVVFAFSSTMAPYALSVPARRRVLDLCDLDSEKWALFAAGSAFPRSVVYRVEARRLARYEAACARRFDATLLVSEPEAATLRSRAPGAALRVVPNGVDLAYYEPSPPGPGAEGRTAVFCGAMDYRANVDAALHYAHDVHPLVRRRVPDARFRIVGARPAAAVRALDGRDGIEVTGRVADVRPHVAACGVSVAPLRLGRGVPNKVLEALALELPLVASAQAIQGLEVRDLPGVAVEDEPARFAEAVVRLLEAARRGRGRYPEHREALARRYRWDAFAAAIREVSGVPTEAAR